MGMNKDLKYTIFWLLLILAGCSNPDTKLAEIARQEADFRTLVDAKGMGEAVRPDAVALKDALIAFADKWPDHGKSPEFLHNAASIAADFLDDPAGAVILFKRVADTYPTNELAERCRFLEAYTLAEFVKDYPAAKEAYGRFILEFPESAMVASAKFEIETMGKPLTIGQ